MALNKHIELFQESHSLSAVEQLMKLQEQAYAPGTTTLTPSIPLLRQTMEKHQITLIKINAPLGSGKVSLVLASIRRLSHLLKIAVMIDGLIAEKDRIRLQSLGVQFTSFKSSSHIEPSSVWNALQKINLESTQVIFLLHVKSVLSPTLVSVGEESQVTLLATTEGDDKPRKFPHLFLNHEIMLISKADLLPYLPFSVQAVIEDAQEINPRLKIITLSTRTGEGLDAWCQWLWNKVNPKKRPMLPS